MAKDKLTRKEKDFFYALLDAYQKIGVSIDPLSEQRVSIICDRAKKLIDKVTE